MAAVLAIQGVAMKCWATGPVKRRPKTAATAARTKAITVVTSRVAPRAKPTRPETANTRPARMSKRVMGRLVPSLIADAGHGLGEARHAGDRHTRAAIGSRGSKGAGEAELGCFLQAHLHSAHRPNVSRQADFAEHHAVLRKGGFQRR